jgi:hypothetical protein
VNDARLGLRGGRSDSNPIPTKPKTHKPLKDARSAKLQQAIEWQKQSALD